MNFEFKKLNMMSDNKKQFTENLNSKQTDEKISKSIHKQPCHYPYSTRNPYDDG